MKTARPFQSAYRKRVFNFETPLDFSTLEDLVHAAREHEVPSHATVVFSISHDQVTFRWERKEGEFDDQ